MEEKKQLILENIINLLNLSELNYKKGSYKKAFEGRKKIKIILKSVICDKQILGKYYEELCRLYSSKFDLINDHKKLIDASKRNALISKLEKISEEKYHIGDFKGAIKALRRSEKYFEF